MPITNTSNNNYSSLVVPVPKDSTFKNPAGKYAANTKSVRRLDRQNSRGSLPYLRILFTVNIPGQENYECLAKADFPLNLENGSDLRNVINRLLGRGYLANLSGQAFDLEDLVDIDCEIELEHVDLNGRENYDFPLVVVADIQLPGTMRLTVPRTAEIEA